MSLIEQIKRDREDDYPLAKIMREKAAIHRGAPVDEWSDSWCDEAGERLERMEAALLVAEKLAEAVAGLHESTGLSSFALSQALSAFRDATR